VAVDEVSDRIPASSAASTFLSEVVVGATEEAGIETVQPAGAIVDVGKDHS
jgi:hypothetical protein